MIKVVTLIYLLIIALVGFFNQRRNSDKQVSLLLVGRRITLWPFTATLVATAYGWIGGIGQMYAELGYAAWLLISLPYLIFALVLAFFWAKPLNTKAFFSIPALFTHHYGKLAGRLASIPLLLFLSPAMYILMTAQLLAEVFTIPMLLAVLLALLFSGFYLVKGGFQSLVSQDIIKFSLMFIGFALAFGVLYHQGDLVFINRVELRMPEFGTLSTWFLLALMVLVDPSYHQRIYAAANGSVAKRGILLAIVFWVLFDVLAAGLAVSAAIQFPHTSTDQVYYHLALNGVPEWVGAILVVGLLAVMMSTADSYLYLSAQTLAHDLLGWPSFDKKHFVRSLLIMMAFTFGLLAWYIQKSVLDLFYDFTPLAIAPLLWPMALTFTSWHKPKYMASVFLLGLPFLTTLAAKWAWVGQTSIHLLVGLSTSILFWLIISSLKGREVKSQKL